MADAIDATNKEAERDATSATDDRLKEHFRVFLGNLKRVDQAMSACIERAQHVLTSYEGISRSIPLALRPFVEHLELIRSQIALLVFDLELHEAEYVHNAANADGRGSWNMILRILFRIVGECNVQISNLPPAQKHESTRHSLARRYTQSHVLPVINSCTESLQVLSAIWPTLTMVTTHPEALSEFEAKTLLASFYTHPFWYSVRTL